MTELAMDTWERRDIYRFFSAFRDPFWSVTCEMDVTDLKTFCRDRGYSFYHTMIYLSTCACSEVEEMLIGVRDGRPVRYDGRDPSFTDIRPGERCFRIITLPFDRDLKKFLENCRRAAAEQKGFIDMEKERDDLIFFSCLPGIPYTALRGEPGNDPHDSAPRMTWGQYFLKDGRLKMPFTLEVNHAFLDGLHAGEFFARLRELLNAPEDLEPCP